MGLLVTVLVLGLAAAGYGLWTVQRSFPITSGRIETPGLDAAVTVTRDEVGVPRVVAETDHDLFYAQGYVHAQDRFWEMDFRRHVTAGRLSELFGESQVATDRFIRTLNWRGIAEQEFELLDDETREGYEAYADGVNAYLETHHGAEVSLEYAVLGLQNPGYSPEPWSPVDSIAWLKAMAWDLRSNLDDEIDRALLATELSPEEVAQLHPYSAPSPLPTILEGAPPEAAPAALSTAPLADPETGAAAAADGYVAALSTLRAAIEGAPELLGPAGGEIGSNSWVVSGALTETEMPMLANDPHLGPAMPSIWYQMNLGCVEVNDMCSYDVSGYSFSGLPGIIIGHNAQIAWGFTNLGPDVADLYIEKVGDETYELDGAQVPLTLREERIEVAGGDPVTFTVRSTERGPIVSDDGGDYATIANDYAAKAEAEASDFEYALSLQWTALKPGTTPQAIFAMNKARDWNEFRDAARLFEVPSQNLVFASTNGDIGYQAPGKIPIRKSGDGTVPLPGWTSDNGWSGFIPYEDLPTLLNPERGYIVTANNAVSTGTDPFITKDWDLGYRAEGIENGIRELIDSGDKIGVGDLADVQMITADANARNLLPVIAELDLDGDAAAGADLLEGWNARADVDSADAAYFNVFWRILLTTMFAELPEGTEPTGGDRWFGVVDALLETPDSRWWNSDAAGVAGRDEMIEWALGEAWVEATDRLGSNPASWRWGKLHTLTIRNQSFGESGIAPIEWLFNRGPYEVGGGSAIVNANGWNTQLGYEVDWVPSMRMVVDLADFDASTWVNLTGASGHAFHPNYDDQTPLWQVGESLPWAFSPSAVEASTEETLLLLPDR